jgi:hypothetical protein
MDASLEQKRIPQISETELESLDGRDHARSLGIPLNPLGNGIAERTQALVLGLDELRRNLADKRIM